jgi:hypothetical protein
MFYYATRTDKNGHRLMTSYGNAASQKKYGGTEAKLFNGVIALHVDGFNTYDEVDDMPGGDELVVRSRMFNSNPEDASNGKFVIMYKDKEGQYSPTPFRTGSYGAANTIMKAIIPMYKELVIIEHGAEGSSESADESAPF